MATNNAINVKGPTPAFSVYNSTDYSFMVGGTDSITFDSAVFDTTSSFTLGSTRFIAPISGIYQFYAAVTASITASGNMTFYFEGSMGYRAFSVEPTPVTSGNKYFFDGSCIVQLNVGDEIRFKYASTGGAEGVALASVLRTSFNGALLFAV